MYQAIGFELFASWKYSLHWNLSFLITPVSWTLGHLASTATLLMLLSLISLVNGLWTQTTWFQSLCHWLSPTMLSMSLMCWEFGLEGGPKETTNHRFLFSKLYFWIKSSHCQTHYSDFIAPTFHEYTITGLWYNVFNFNWVLDIRYKIFWFKKFFMSNYIYFYQIAFMV